MRHIFKTAALTALLALGAAGGVNSASAQGFSVRIGEPDYDRRVERRVYRDERPRRVIEERVIRRPAASRTVCRTEVQERIRRDGAYVRKPVQVCRQVVGGGGYRGY